MADTTSLESRLEELLEQDKFPPPDEFREKAVVSDESVYEEADKDYEGFWEQQAEALDWEQKWDQVLHGLYACGLRAVLAEKDCDVHTLAHHVVVETLRDEGTFLVVKLEKGRRTVLGRPLPPGLFQGRKTRGMDVGVYQRDPVQQTTGPSRRPSLCPTPMRIVARPSAVRAC